MPLPLLLLHAELPVPPPTPPAEGIVITGRDLPRPPGEAAFATVTLDADEIARPEQPLLENTLRELGGVQQFRRSDSRSASPTSQGLTLRGLGGNASSRTLVLLDGVPQADPFGGWIDWTAFERQRIASATLVRGGGTGADGPGALAGTLILESAAPGPGTSGEARAGGGSFGTADAAVLVQVGVGGGGVSLGADFARADGFVPIVEASRGGADRPASYRRGGATLRVVTPVGPETELQASLGGFADDRSRGVDFVGSTLTGGDASVRLVHRGRWQASALVYGQLRKLTASFASVSADRATATPVLDQYNVPSSGVGARAEVRPPLTGPVTLRLGADWRRVEGETREAYLFVAGAPTRLRRAGTDTTTLGGFIAGDWRAAPPLTVTASARIDRWRVGEATRLERGLDGTVFTEERVGGRTGWEPTGRLGAVLALAPGLDARAAASLGWRLPTVNELARPFRAGADATAANPGLSPERSRTLEAGLDWRPAEDVRLSATAFDAEVTDAIANVTLGRGPGVFPGVGFVGRGGAYRQRLNVNAVRSRGVELDGRVERGPWSGRLSLSVLDARLRASGAAAALDGRRPAQVAGLSGSLALGWRSAVGARLDAMLDHTGPQFEDDANDERLRAATVLDLSGSLPVTDRVSAWVRLDNALGERVEAAVDGTVIERARPRTLTAGFAWRFGG